jgi:hypothetical protein
VACFSLVVGAELLKHFINRGRPELLKELKQVQLQVLELQEQLTDKRRQDLGFQSARTIDDRFLSSAVDEPRAIGARLTSAGMKNRPVPVR